MERFWLFHTPVRHVQSNQKTNCLGPKFHKTRHLTPVTNLLIATVVILVQAIVEDQKTEKVDKVQLRRWKKYYREVAAQYQMSYSSGRALTLQLQPQPVITYFNPVGGGQTLGAIFVWMHEGRPEIAGAIWSKRDADRRRIIH